MDDVLDGEVYVTADDLDKELLNQLHAATLKASDSCFEIKKLCATVLVPTGTLVMFLSDRRVNAVIFVSGLLVIFSFWMADAVGFYYQRRLRVVMAAVWERRAGRSDRVWPVPRTKLVKPWRAAFNGSMAFYAILAIPIVVGYILYVLGHLDSPPPAQPKVGP